jgi:flagellar secretion chaperone FliS
MWQDAQNVYLESRVLAADPIELVRLMYQAAIDAVRNARQRLAEGDIAGRSRSISKACDILIELNSVLDHARAGDISQRLAQLYDYMQRRLLEANMRQEDASLAEVLGLLVTLSEAWAGVQGGAQPPAAPEIPWTQPVQPVPPEPRAYASSEVWERGYAETRPAEAAEGPWEQRIQPGQSIYTPTGAGGYSEVPAAAFENPWAQPAQSAYTPVEAWNGGYGGVLPAAAPQSPWDQPAQPAQSACTPVEAWNGGYGGVLPAGAPDSPWDQPMKPVQTGQRVYTPQNWSF